MSTSATALGRPHALADVVEEYFDELDFLWEHREANLFTPDWTLSDLAEHEERAEAHLDGLRLSELHGIDLALERLGDGEPFAAAAAAFVLFDSGAVEYRARLADALREADDETVDGCRLALRHRDLTGFVPLLEELLRGDEPFRAAASWDVLAFHRRPAERVESALADASPATRILALGAAGRSGTLTVADVAGAMTHEDAAVRRAALDAAARSAMPNLLPFCRDAALRQVDPDPEAVRFLGVLGGASEVSTLSGLLARPELAEVAVEALGALGRVEAVPGLLELMADEAMGPAATVAYRRITGAGDVEGEKPFPPPEVEEGEDEEEALPPDPAKARADWARRSGELAPGLRWQGGLGVTDGQLPLTFDAMTLEARRAVYLRLRVTVPTSAPDLELEALAAQQGQPR